MATKTAPKKTAAAPPQKTTSRMPPQQQPTPQPQQAVAPLRQTAVAQPGADLESAAEQYGSAGVSTPVARSVARPAKRVG